MNRLRYRFTNYALFGSFVFSMALLVLFAVFQNPLEQILGQHPFRYFGLPLLAAMTILLGLVFVLSQRRRIRLFKPSDRSYRTGWLIIVVGIVALGVVWLFLPPPTVHPLFVILRLYIAGVVIGGIAWALAASSTTDLTVSQHWITALIVIAVAAALFLTARYIGRFPQVLVFDEPAEINLSWSMFETRAFHWAMFPAMSAQEVALSYTILNPVAGAWMSLTGIGLIQARLFFLIFGWISIPFIYLAARELYGEGVARLTLPIAVFIPLAHNYTRPDMLVVTTTSVALYLFLRARKTNARLLHYLVGLVLGFGLEGHPYAVRFGVAFGLIYSVEYLLLLRKAKQWRWNPAFWSFVLGGATYLVFYVVVHILVVANDPMKFGGLSTIYGQEVAYSDNRAVGITRVLLDNLAFYQQYFQLHLPEAVLALVVVIAAVVRRTAADKLLLAIFIPSLVIGAVLLAHVNPYYWVFNMPFIAIWGGVLLARISYKSDGVHLAAIASVGIIVVLLTTHAIVAGDLPQAADSFTAIARQIDQRLPGDITTVIGDRIFYLGILNHRDFISVDAFEPPIQDIDHPAPWALIVTGIAGDKNDPFVHKMQNYAAKSQKARAYCYYMSSYEISVYLPELKLPTGAPLGCRAD